MLDWRITPDQRALKVAYPIAAADGGFRSYHMSRQFNEGIRQMARQRDLGLIDFEGYAYREFDRRSDYFTDSVHMTIRGYAAFGRFLATELEGRIGCE